MKWNRGDSLTAGGGFAGGLVLTFAVAATTVLGLHAAHAPLTAPRPTVTVTVPQPPGGIIPGPKGGGHATPSSSPALGLSQPSDGERLIAVVVTPSPVPVPRPSPSPAPHPSPTPPATIPPAPCLLKAGPVKVCAGLSLGG